MQISVDRPWMDSPAFVATLDENLKRAMA